jgi:hypothetical protein
MTSLTASAKNIFRPFKRTIESILPKRLSIKPPIVQAYLGGKYESRFTLVNFPSLYSPLNACPCIYDIELYDSNGYRIGKKSLTIEAFGSIEVRPGEFFDGPLPDFGMFTAIIRPANPASYKHLGEISSHFYALYSDKAQNSFALVHPQTYINAPRSSSQEWVSGYILDAHKIRKIAAIQINPTKKNVDTNLFLFREGMESNRIGEMPDVIPPMGARMVEWDLTKVGIKDEYFSVAAVGFPTNNGKPIILTHFEDGSFSGMHG